MRLLGWQQKFKLPPASIGFWILELLTSSIATGCLLVAFQHHASHFKSSTHSCFRQGQCSIHSTLVRCGCVLLLPR